jgi:hypothetical protein
MKAIAARLEAAALALCQPVKLSFSDGRPIMSQKSRFGGEHLCLVIIVLGAIASPLCCAQEKVPLPLDDPNTVIAKVLAALKRVERPATGRGKASMTVENTVPTYEGKKLTVEFAFKDQMSRTDIFAADESGKRSRLHVRARSEKASVLVAPQNAEIRQRELHHLMVGYDFSPATFFGFSGRAITEELELALAHPNVKRCVDLDDHGILRFVSEGSPVVPGGKPHCSSEIHFDTRNGFRPVFSERRFNKEDGSSSGWTVDLKWAEYNSVWYVSRAEYNEQPDNRQHTVVTVEDFTPNGEVADEEFTLAGMDIPNGMWIADRMEGFAYRYGHKDSVTPLGRPASPQQPPHRIDPDAAIETVLSALKEIKHPTSGRGTGAMTIKDLDTENEERNFLLKFAFKGPNSVADIVAQDASGTQTRWYCEVNSPTAIIRVRKWGARIEPPEVHQPELGFDFRPEMFVSCFGGPITEHLEAFLALPHVPRSVELDGQDILRLTVGKPSNMNKFSFDTRKGYRPVYYEWRITKADGTWNADTTTLEWAQYDGVWYVSRGEVKTLPNSGTVHRIFTIRSFKPNVEIGDKEFTLDGLGLPDGFPVSDSIEGTTYRYGDKTRANRIVHRASP